MIVPEHPGGSTRLAVYLPCERGAPRRTQWRSSDSRGSRSTRTWRCRTSSPTCGSRATGTHRTPGRVHRLRGCCHRSGGCAGAGWWPLMLANGRPCHPGRPRCPWPGCARPEPVPPAHPWSTSTSRRPSSPLRPGRGGARSDPQSQRQGGHPDQGLRCPRQSWL